MAYVNVKDWNVDQVTDWLKGLDGVVSHYTTSFLNNGVTGGQLLSLRVDDLEHLGVKLLGHQEIILEAVEHLRHFHYELDKENLQSLSLKLSCAANSLYRELLSVEDDSTPFKPQTLSDVHNIISTIKPLVFWLERAPFAGDKDYIDCKTQMLQLAFEMATNAHRDIFSEQPVVTIRKICEKLTKMADHIIQDINDPMILQPASLDLATLKKRKEQELGFYIFPSNHAIHQIADIKFGSPAHSSSKIEEGDEIVQVNYMTVVGWQRKNVMFLLQESPPEIVLTLKKRPRHTKVYGQIYMKPYRLPSKKRGQPYSRWNENLPSPVLLPIPDILSIKVNDRISPINDRIDSETEISEEDSDIESPPDSPMDNGTRMYPLKPRAILQRRNTFSGGTSSNSLSFFSFEQCRELLKNQANLRHSSSNHINNSNFGDGSKCLRDKSMSCSVGLELGPRPTTVIGLSSKKQSSFKKSNKKRVNFDERVGHANLDSHPKVSSETNLNEERSLSLNSLRGVNEASISYIDEGRELTDRSSMTSGWQKEIVDELIDAIKSKPINPSMASPTPPDEPENSLPPSNACCEDEPEPKMNVHEIVKKLDRAAQAQNANATKPKVLPRTQIKKQSDVKKPVVPPRTATTLITTTRQRGRLDKSHSTPAYDPIGETEDVVIEAENPTINLELGIPNALPSEIGGKRDQEQKEILPPKPPPRTFRMVDSNKPAYPADSPKPQNLMDQTKQTTPKRTSRIFEFPEATSSPVPVVVNKTPTTSRNAVVPVSKNGSASEINKTDKVSPTNSIVRAMIYSNKGRPKRKNLVSRRRKVTVNDLCPADIQGWLYQRLRVKLTHIRWEKRWFVLVGNCLYGYKTKTDPRAACLIFLSGFTVAVANEVKSRSNAFKVYHTGTVFYFSADDPDSLQNWIDLITSATLTAVDTRANDVPQFSETDDDSDAEKVKSVASANAEKTSGNDSSSLKKFGSLKKFSSSKKTSTTSNSNDGSTSLDRKWFFNKSGGQKNALPVPTAHFRSYRKIRNDDSPQIESITTGNFTSHVPFLVPSIKNISVPNLATKSPNTNAKTSNYMHTSNPSLCNVNEYGCSTPAAPIPIKKSRKPSNDNLAGFVTLEELMIQQTEERKLNPHSAFEDMTQINFNLIKPDVVYGEVPIRSKESPESSSESGSSCFGKRLGSLKKNQKIEFDGKTATYPKTTKVFDKRANSSLPRMHKLQEKYRNDELGSRYFSDRNLLAADRSYEMIYCPETVTEIVQFAQNRSLGNVDVSKKTKIKKQYSFSATSDKKSKSERSLFDLNRSKVTDTSVGKIRLKSAMQYTPMALPLSQDPKALPRFAFELNLDEKSTKSTTKFKQIFSKQATNDPKKEKTFLGSPKLHRAIFRRNDSNGPILDTAWPGVATQMIYPESPYSTMDSEQALSPLLPPAPNPDYPGLEYPPIFEPETYSLADPQSSLSILRKQGK